MYGTLITNAQLEELRTRNQIQIHPFRRVALKTTHYTLLPGRILGLNADRSLRQLHSFLDAKGTYMVPPNEYVIVEVLEHVKITDTGIVGRFIPASNLIEAGFDLVAGQIDNQYGKDGERLHFGLKNLIGIDNPVSHNTRLAHVEFFDLRAVKHLQPTLTNQEKRLRAIRSGAADDGVAYPEDDSN